MNRLAFALGACLLTSSAGFAGAPAAKPAACPYHAGQALTATIQITVHDRDIQADSASVKLDLHIPAGGRVTSDGSYVAPPSPAVPVKLANDTLTTLRIARFGSTRSFRGATGLCKNRRILASTERSPAPS